MERRHVCTSKGELTMHVILVGGNPAEKKASRVLYKLASIIKDTVECQVDIYNGELPEDISNGDLVLWTPDIPNEQPKDYPVKGRGAVLICSKVMREGYTKVDAVSRIFKMQGNAVISIYKNDEKDFKFGLIDALGNTWAETKDLKLLCSEILALYSWTKGSIRVSIPQCEATMPVLTDYDENVLNLFVKLNKDLAYKVASQVGNRYFGNYSTRCTKLFPSMRDGNIILMSPRNVDKRTITTKDMVPIYAGAYIGDRKPSVDAPVQLKIYEKVDWVNYLIHGHAFIMGTPATKHYYPCGDLREAPEVIGALRDGRHRINLKNHGFLIAAENINELEDLIKWSKFRQLH